ncbi:MAG: hypothetical protein SNJ29_11605 [Rikenellaceae bacterium]
MTMCEIWNWVKDAIVEVFKYLGGAAALAALLSLVFRQVVSKTIDSWFEKKNKKYQKDIDKELKDYQTQLDDKSKEVQHKLDTQLEVLKIRLTPLQEKRLHAIQDVYDELVLFHDAILRYVSIIKQQEWGSDQKIWSEVCNHGNELTSIWSHNKLFFTKEIATDMELLIKGSYYKLSEYNHAQSQATQTNGNREWEQVNTLGSEVETGVMSLMDKIETNFRTILGVE